MDGASDINGGNSFFKSLLGVPSYCLAGIEGDLESKCVLTPVCWLSGGVPHKGCNSMLYTCCVDAALSRKVSLKFELSNRVILYINKELKWRKYFCDLDIYFCIFYSN